MGEKELYRLWREKATGDADLIEELTSMEQDPERIRDAFYRDLEFGTGGLRGVIGAGTNRMNIYTVARASRGLANYLVNHYGADASVVIGYDSRIKSERFAKTAAQVFSANGVNVSIWPTLNPVPTVSFAVRHLGKKAGVMITASHNPSKYNGYKVYGADGCQITQEAAGEITAEIEKLDMFEPDTENPDAVSADAFFVPNSENADRLSAGTDKTKGNSGTDISAAEEEVQICEECEKSEKTVFGKGVISEIPDDTLTAFLDEVKAQSVLYGDDIDRNVSIVYSPLNGTGRIPVTRVLRESGYTNITMVKEQELPDGHFPTCPYPNPEIREAMALGMEYAAKTGADLLLATDPDCDRVGIAVRNPENGEYVLLSGNETGLLLLDYICAQKKAHGRMPLRPVMVKTIVTMDLAERIAEGYGVETVNVLTGFKYIGETIGRMEREGRAQDYLFGFEESYGYLSGTYVRDKDGVDAAFLICEMFCFYKTRGVSLLEKLAEIYRKYGYCRNTLHSYEYEGADGLTKMRGIMDSLRKNYGNGNFGGRQIRKVLDYRDGLDGLPKSDVLKYLLDDHASLVIRPSGTEPKLKVYVSVTADSREEAETIEQRMVADLEKQLM